MHSVGALKKVTIYSDGACSGNPGPGGWGAHLMCDNHAKEIYGFELQTTNNRMELIAAIKALEALKTQCVVDLYTDSKYVQMGISQWINTWIKNNWCTSNKQPVKNIDLWQNLFSLINFHDVKWHWVKGHSNNKYNTIADNLAVKGKNEALSLL
jgi:ribonuclease HI